jgi:transposase
MTASTTTRSDAAKACSPRVIRAAKSREAVRELYTIDDPHAAADWVNELADTGTDSGSGLEVRGRTLRRWAAPIAAWHALRAANGPTEAINNLAERIKRVAFG